MPLDPNAVMTFRTYSIEDGGVTMRFECLLPGAGQPTDWFIFLTDAEIATVTNLATFNTLVTAKLTRKFRGNGIAARLDSLIGRSITI